MAIFLRLVIMALGQTAIFLSLEALLAPLMEKAKKELSEARGLTPEEATDTLANAVIDAAEFAGITLLTLKSRLPLKIAEGLGFTSKGFVRRTLSTKAVTSGAEVAVKAATKITPVSVVTATEATQLIEVAKKVKTGFLPAYDILIKTLGVTFLGFLTIGNWIDFGNWNSGAYQKSMQRFLEWISFGALVPDADYRKSKTVSPEIFDKVFQTFTLNGAQGIQDPYKEVDVPFTRDNFLDLLDKVGASLLLNTGGASAKNVLAAVLPMIIFPADFTATIPAGGSYTAGGSAPSVVSGISIPKVFTGVVSQGVVGQGMVFTPRPDDLIESVEELRQAAANNLTPYLNTLLGKIVYEVKIVSSIVTKEGFKQSGQTQQIRNGTYQNGEPKYKTVTNKFATLIIYALTDKGSRTKLTTIVLGPTNSAKLLVSTDTLRSVETALPALVTTNDISEIKGLETSNPITITTPPASNGTSVPVSGTAPVVTPASSASQQTPTAQAVGHNALTLFEWYQSRGQALPSVSARSLIYEQMGLGNSSFYAGTAEQNTKLLEALKKSVAPAPSSSGSQSSAGASSSSGSATSGMLPKDEYDSKGRPVFPKVGKPDSTGKVVSQVVRQSDGDIVITYKDKSKRTVKVKK